MIGSRLSSGAGYTLKVPAIDLTGVGAGGGSVIWIDAGGALQIGPHSAGASPGPVCYDLGGTLPTLTDVNVVLGYINPDHLVDGALKLNASKARSVIAETVARPLGMTVEKAAWGAHLIAGSNMIRAMKAVSSERGRDPRDYALVAFGGNGPLFAAVMAAGIDDPTGRDPAFGRGFLVLWAALLRSRLLLQQDAEDVARGDRSRGDSRDRGRARKAKPGRVSPRTALLRIGSRSSGPLPYIIKVKPSNWRFRCREA
jgi:hypothetical protein